MSVTINVKRDVVVTIKANHGETGYNLDLTEEEAIALRDALNYEFPLIKTTTRHTPYPWTRPIGVPTVTYNNGTAREPLNTTVCGNTSEEFVEAVRARLNEMKDDVTMTDPFAVKED